MNSAQMLALKKLIEQAEAHRQGDHRKFAALKKEVAKLGLTKEEEARANTTIGKKLGV